MQTTHEMLAGQTQTFCGKVPAEQAAYETRMETHDALVELGVMKEKRKMEEEKKRFLNAIKKTQLDTIDRSMIELKDFDANAFILSCSTLTKKDIIDGARTLAGYVDLFKILYEYHADFVVKSTENVSALQSKITALDAVIEELSDDVEESRITAADSKDETEEKIVEIDRLNVRMRSQSVVNESLIKDIQDKTRTMNSLMAKVADMRAELHGIRTELKKVQGPSCFKMILAISSMLGFFIYAFGYRSIG